jgi:hypothetical protein
MVTRACQPILVMVSTCPTGTSATITEERGTTLSASAKSARTKKPSSLLTLLPGSGRS